MKTVVAYRGNHRRCICSFQESGIQGDILHLHMKRRNLDILTKGQIIHSIVY